MRDIFRHKDAAVICGIALCMTACDATIHEYPSTGKSLVIIEPHVARTSPLYYKEVTYDKAWNREVRELEETPAAPFHLGEDC